MDELRRLARPYEDEEMEEFDDFEPVYRSERSERAERTERAERRPVKAAAAVGDTGPMFASDSGAKEIRRRFGSNTPIMLISAYDWSEIEAEAKDAGITGFISKPLFRSTLFYGLKPFVDGGGAVEQIREEKRADFTGCHILLAEDNDLNWEIANELLSDLGMELDWAENGRICVDKFENSPVGFYDAVLMDLRMPVMTGYEATAAIRGLDRPDRDIPIIAMTADAFSEDIKKCLDAGMNAHVAKPIDIREISRLLEKFISERH